MQVFGLSQARQNEQQKARDDNEKAAKAKSEMPDFVNIIEEPSKGRSEQIWNPLDQKQKSVGVGKLFEWNQVDQDWWSQCIIG